MDPSRDVIGAVIKGTYRIDAFLGEGGPSIVYRGTDLLLDVTVAIKRLKHHAAMGDGSSMAERFLREGRTQARLVHQNIIGIRAVLEEAGEYYIVMEFVDGCDLSRLLAEVPQQRLSFDSVASVFLQALRGLGYAHEHQVIHRDIKPSNIMVTPEYRVKIADFGIARAVTDARITQTGYLVGTVAYMSPEQLKGMKVDHRADIYSLGISLFEAVTGTHPFRIHEDEMSNFEVMSRHIYEEAPAVSKLREGTPPLFDQVVARALAKEPDERFPTCEAFARALEGALKGGGVDASSPSVEIMRKELEQPFAMTKQRHHPAHQDTHEIQTPKALGNAAPDGGTGAFNRDAMTPAPATNKDISEERPSGVLVSVTPSPKSNKRRGTVDAPISPAQRLMKPAAERSTKPIPPPTIHDLDAPAALQEAIAQSQKTQMDTGSFYREQPDEVPPEGAVEQMPALPHQAEPFDRKALSQKIQQQKTPSKTGVFDREANAPTTPQSAPTTPALSPTPATAASPTTGHPPNTKQIGVQTIASSTGSLPGLVSAPSEQTDVSLIEEREEPPATSGKGGLFFALLCVCLLIGGGLVWTYRANLLPTKPGPSGLASTDARTTHPSQRPDAANGTVDRQTPSLPGNGRASPMAPLAATCPGGHGKMAHVKGGWFQQGEVKASKRSDRRVRSSYVSSFCIDRYEVTARQYQRCVSAKVCTSLRQRSAPALPVRWISWGQAFTYCRWAGYKRLPTEAEWEYAARGQTQTVYPWGDKDHTPTCDKAVHRGCKGPLPADANSRRAFGLHDMLGNVWEWVHDCYSADAYRTLPPRNPKQEPTGSLRGSVNRLKGCRRRVIRGGSYRSSSSSIELMPFFRGRMNVTRVKPDVGFRCATSPRTPRKSHREL